VTPLLPFTCELGESPVWSVHEQALYWTDISGRRIHRCDPATGAECSWRMPSEPGCLALDEHGGLVVALRDGFHRFDPASLRIEPLARVDLDRSRMRFNDGRCDARGRFWAGTVDERREQPIAGLWCLERGRLSAGPDGRVLCNGLAFAPDGRWMYHADTERGVIHRHPYDLERGVAGPAAVWRRFEPSEGRPDGAAVDAEGCYWVAMYEAGCVLRLDPDGRTILSLPVPVRCPTMVAFGGPALRTLYVTTSRRRRPALELGEHPLSGAVFFTEVEPAGLPEPRYRG